MSLLRPFRVFSFIYWCLMWLTQAFRRSAMRRRSAKVSTPWLFPGFSKIFKSGREGQMWSKDGGRGEPRRPAERRGRRILAPKWDLNDVSTASPWLFCRCWCVCFFFLLLHRVEIKCHFFFVYMPVSFVSLILGDGEKGKRLLWRNVRTTFGGRRREIKGSAGTTWSV